MCTVPPTGLGVPAVGTRGLFLLETRISQEMDKTACAHQVSVGALWWGKKLRNQSNKVHRDGGNKKKQKKKCISLWILGGKELREDKNIGVSEIWKSI